MKKRNLMRFLYLYCLVATTISCSSDNETSSTHNEDFRGGYLVLNQGNFGQENATLTYINDDLISSNQKVNNLNLGDTGQHIYKSGNRIFVVLNASSEVVVLDATTLNIEHRIETELYNPRYLSVSNNQIYISNWGAGIDPSDDFIAVFDLNNYQHITNISVAEGPERLLENNNTLYVAQTGGYNYGNSITMINTTTNTVENSIVVGDVPNSMSIVGDDLFVLNAGLPSWTGTPTEGSIVKVQLNTEVITTIGTLNVGAQGANLQESNNKLYYNVGADIYEMSVDASTLPTTSVVNVSNVGTYDPYAVLVDDGTIFVADALDFNSNGKVHIYKTSGEFVNTIPTGVIPAGILKK